MHLCLFRLFMSLNTALNLKRAAKRQVVALFALSPPHSSLPPSHCFWLSSAPSIDAAAGRRSGETDGLGLGIQSQADKHALSRQAEPQLACLHLPSLPHCCALVAGGLNGSGWVGAGGRTSLSTFRPCCYFGQPAGNQP